jgi:hypothetical protein
LERNDSRVLIANADSYIDLSLFQMIKELCYAFPRAMTKQARNIHE